MDGSPSMITDRFTPSPSNERAFRDALGRFATGVTVVTAQSPSGPVGFTASSFASVSLDPPLVLWSPARASSRFGVFEAAEYFAIHVLGDRQTALGNRFAQPDSSFDGVDWHASPEGMPLIPGCLARFECARYGAYDGGDHLILVGRVLRVETCAGDPLVYAAGRFGGFDGPDTD